MPVELLITFKGSTIAQSEKFPNLKEAVAYLWGKAVTGDLNTADSISIYPDKEQDDNTSRTSKEVST